MSDRNSDRKTTVRQENTSNSRPDYFGSSKANFKMAGHHAMQGAAKSMDHYSRSVSSTGPSQSNVGKTMQAAGAIGAGRKEYGQAAKDATRAAGDWSKGAIRGFGEYANQGADKVANYNNMKMYQAMAPKQRNNVGNARAKASQEKQSSGYKPKANQMNQSKVNQPVNKGIEAARQKSAAKQTVTKTGPSTNQGIKSYQSKAGGQSAGSSKGSASSGAAKGSSSSSGKSGGSSSGSQSGGSSKGR